MASDNGTDLTFSPGHSLIHVLTKYSDKTKCILVFYDAHSSAYTVSLKGQRHFHSTKTASHKHYLHWSSFILLTFMMAFHYCLYASCVTELCTSKKYSLEEMWMHDMVNNSILKPEYL